MRTAEDTDRPVAAYFVDHLPPSGDWMSSCRLTLASHPVAPEGVDAQPADCLPYSTRSGAHAEKRVRVSFARPLVTYPVTTSPENVCGTTSRRIKVKYRVG